MQKDFRLKPVSILLKQHSLKELKQVYTEVNGKAPKQDKTHLQLVHELASDLSINALLESWPEKAFAYNTSLKFLKVTNDKTKEKIENGAKIIKAHFTQEAWTKITEQGYVPRELSEEGHLLQVAQTTNKTFFLFASPGRSKEVIEDLNVRYLVQPQFTIAVWNNKESTIQIRGMEVRETATSKLRNYMWINDRVEPVFEQIKIYDKEQVKKLAKALGGKAHRGKFVNPDNEIEEATYVSQADTDLYATAKVKQAEKEGYNQHSAGIDFVFQGESYTVWVGFSAGTFWIRAGTVTEEVIDYLEAKILSI